MKDIKVSVIVPMYNKEQKISKCLDSLINQTLREIEIVVVDDGSKDNSAEIVKKYCEKDSRVRYVKQDNQGPGAARNVGIINSKGHYIGFVDCDDYVEHEMYEIMYNAAEQNNCEVAVCQEKNVYVDDEGHVTNLGETHFPYNEITVVTGKMVLEWFLNFNYLSLNSACFKIVRKSVFVEKDIYFPDNYRYAEDLTICGGILSVAKSVAVIPKSLYIYEHESNTFSTSYTLKKAMDVYLDLMDVLKYLERVEYTGNINNFILGMSFSSKRQLYASSEKKNRNYQREKTVLLAKWKDIKKGIHPEFKGVDMPFMHKIKVIVSWMRLEKIMCYIINILSGIPFFRFMV